MVCAGAYAYTFFFDRMLTNNGSQGFDMGGILPKLDVAMREIGYALQYDGVGRATLTIEEMRLPHVEEDE